MVELIKIFVFRQIVIEPQHITVKAGNEKLLIRDYYSGFATEAEAEQFAADMGWCYLDENQFAWNLYVEEDFYDLQRVAKNRNTEEVQAESVSYAVCQYFGIETGENSFGYIATWSKGKELDELKASLEIINKTSCELINDIERNYKEICKERGIDLTAAPEPEQAPQQAVEESTPAEEAVQPSAEYQQTASAQLPDAQEQALDEYPMPDPALTQDDLEKCGYRTPSTPMRFRSACTSSVVVGNFSVSPTSSPSLYFPRFVM